VTDVAKKGIGFLVIAFAAFYLVTQPEGAAHAIRGAVDAVLEGLDSLLTFLGELAG